MEQYALTPESVKEATDLLQIVHSETDVKDVSPSTETVAEEPNQESSTFTHEELNNLITTFFPEDEATEGQYKDILKNSKGELQWAHDAITIIHAGHVEKNNVYDPVGLVGWWIAKQPRELARNRAQSISKKPKSQGSILGETLDRARRQAPPKPGPTPEKIEAMKRRNEAARDKAE